VDDREGSARSPAGRARGPLLQFLERGDEECLRALGGGRGAQTSWTRAFEAWHEALAAAEPGEAVPTARRTEVAELAELQAERWPDRDGTFERRTEAVEYAVQRRLAGLTDEERTGWITRFSPMAEEALGRTSLGLAERAAELAELERLHPVTEAAARACLELFEVAFEEGRQGAARIWLERADRHAQLAGWSSSAPGIQLRGEALGAMRPTVAAAPPRWPNAGALELTRHHRLVLPGWQKNGVLARMEGPPGIAFLSGGRIAVQTTNSVWILAELEPDRAFEPWKVARELGHPPPDTVDRTGRRWFFSPESDGTCLYLVSGRADEIASNFVQKIRPPRELDVPEPVWSLGGGGLFDSEGRNTPLAEVLDEGLWEFQPGALLAGDLLLVQARQWSQVERDGVLQANAPGEARAWLLALDAATGVPRWKRFLCRGTDIVADFGNRFVSRDLLRTPAQPPALAGPRVFVGTNLGAGFLLDLADGRLAWSFRCRRREASVAGWKGTRRPPVCEDPEGKLPPTVLWAPADSDFLYALHAGLDFGPETLASAAQMGSRAPRTLAHPPLAIGEAELLVGGRPDEALVLGRAGARHTLSAHRLDTGRRYDAVYLGREEKYLAGPLVSDSHVLVAADRGLYLFDRDRELYLELQVPFDLRSPYAPGGLHARGKELFLLAGGELWFFEVRRGEARLPAEIERGVPPASESSGREKKKRRRRILHVSFAFEGLPKPFHVRTLACYPAFWCSREERHYL